MTSTEQTTTPTPSQAVPEETAAQESTDLKATAEAAAQSALEHGRDAMEKGIEAAERVGDAVERAGWGSTSWCRARAAPVVSWRCSCRRRGDSWAPR